MSRAARAGASSLVETVQGLLERTYGMRSGVVDLGRFFIGDRTYRTLYGHPRETNVGSAISAVGARLLVRSWKGSLRASIYLPDDLVRRLERFPPQQGLGAENVDEFATLVEELDHLLLLAERSRLELPLTLFEMELHANVSKHLVLERFLAGRRPRLSSLQRCWLRRQLFGEARFAERDVEIRGRYRDAVRWSVRFLEALPRKCRRHRLEALRRFHAASSGGKLRLISDLELHSASG